jgi:hypothetical protein
VQTALYSNFLVSQIFRTKYFSAFSYDIFIISYTEGFEFIPPYIVVESIKFYVSINFNCYRDSFKFVGLYLLCVFGRLLLMFFCVQCSVSEWCVILCDMCIFVMLCLIVVPLPQGENP